MSEARLEQHYESLMRFATRRLGSSEAAADLVQDVYLRSAAMPPEQARNAKSYLFTIASRLIIDQWRRKRRLSRADANDFELERAADKAPDAEASVLSREELRVLMHAIDALPPRTRMVFRLHRFEELSYAEIAEKLAISKNTVMVHMVNALTQLRAVMQDHRRPANG